MNRVLLLTPSVRMLGARQSLLLLSTHFPPDWEPLVVCPGRDGLALELASAGIPYEVIPHGAWRKLGGRIKALTLQLPALRKLARRFRPHVVHANEFHSTPAAAVAARACRAAMTTHVRLSITPRQIKTYGLAEARRIAAVSEACAKLFDGSGLDQRVKVVYNGVDLSGFAPPTELERSELRRELGWSDEDFVVGLLGLVSPRKNQLVAAEAVALARSRGVPARLLLAGDAFKSTMEYGDRVRARIEQDDLKASAVWLPFQRDVRRLYAAMDVNLLISSEEGFGRTIIEAGAMEVPSIGARTGGIPELIVEGKTGWLVDEGNAGELAKLIEGAWREKNRIAEMGRETRLFVTDRFGLEAHVRAMIGIWEEATVGFCE